MLERVRKEDKYKVGSRRKRFFIRGEALPAKAKSLNISTRERFPLKRAICSSCDEARAFQVLGAISLVGAAALDKDEDFILIPFIIKRNSTARPANKLNRSMRSRREEPTNTELACWLTGCVLPASEAR